MLKRPQPLEDAFGEACWKMTGHMERGFQSGHPDQGSKYMSKAILDHQVLTKPG